MIKFAKLAVFSSLAVLFMAVPAMAQGAAGGGFSVNFTGYFGVGLTVIGAAYGIGKLASSALESMARQPEAAAGIQVAMIISAALIEGFTFYALFICSQ